MIELSPFAWTTFKLFGGVFGVLVLASAIGAVLKWRVGARPAALGHRQPQLARERVVGDGGGHRHRLCLRQAAA
jgi:hypothetical protein